MVLLTNVRINASTSICIHMICNRRPFYFMKITRQGDLEDADVETVNGGGGGEGGGVPNEYMYFFFLRTIAMAFWG